MESEGLPIKVISVDVAEEDVVWQVKHLSLIMRM